MFNTQFCTSNIFLSSSTPKIQQQYFLYFKTMLYKNVLNQSAIKTTSSECIFINQNLTARAQLGTTVFHTQFCSCFFLFNLQEKFHEK